MKLSLKKFTEVKNTTKKELLGTGEDKYNAKPKFSKYAFEWDFHHAYPPSVSRLFFWWKKGEVYGKRKRNIWEGPFVPDYFKLDDEYLNRVFNQ